ncbi:MAG: OsmC family protein [Roseiarcus sp.]
MTNNMKGIVKQRQDPLRERYRTALDEARITDSAKTAMNGSEDPFHTTVAPGEEYGASWRVGIHRVIGGYHDFPNPGEILCAALASCLHSTLRIIADRLEIPIVSLEVSTRAELDARGTLLVDRNVPVGFQQIKCQIRLKPAANVPLEKVKMLQAAAEYSCVVLQTLRNGVPVQTQFDEIQSLADLAVQ